MSENYPGFKARVETIEEAVRLLTHMAMRADERLDTTDLRLDITDVRVDTTRDLLRDAAVHIAEIDSTLANVSVKLEALTDAQLHTEAALAQLRTTQQNLAASQTQSDKRLDGLIEIIRVEREGRSGH